jgi:hypothetical protein
MKVEPAIFSLAIDDAMCWPVFALDGDWLAVEVQAAIIRSFVQTVRDNDRVAGRSSVNGGLYVVEVGWPVIVNGNRACVAQMHNQQESNGRNWSPHFDILLCFYKKSAHISMYDRNRTNSRRKWANSLICPRASL